MWNVRRLCDRDPLDGRRPRARVRPGRRDRRAVHERGQPRGARQPGDRAAEPSRRHRRDPLHRRSTCSTPPARRRRCSRPATRWSCARPTAPSSAVARPVFQVAIIDVDTGLVVTTATSRPADVPDDGRRATARSSAGFRGCRCGRGSTSCGCRSPTAISSRRTTSVTAGPRFAVSGHGSGVEGLADEEDGLVSLPFEFAHHAGDVPALPRGVTPARSGRARLDSARRRRRQHAAHRPGRPAARRRTPRRDVVIVSPLVKDAAFVREFAHPRVRFEDLPPHRPAGLEGAAAGARAGRLPRLGRHRVGADPPGRRRSRRRTIRWIRAQAAAGARRSRRRSCGRRRRYDVIDRLVSHPCGRAAVRSLSARRCSSRRARADLLRSAAAADRRAPRRAVDGGRSELGQLHEQAAAGPPRRSADRLERPDEAAGGRAARLRAGRGARRRHAAVGSATSAPGTLASREAFFRQIGADPSRKLITLTTTPRELYPHHDHVLRVLMRAMDDGAWREPAQVLVRLHPRDDRDAYAEFEGAPHVMIEKPFRSTVTAGDGLAVDITADNQRHLADTMRHSDVVVNVASTIAIEAAIFDTPVVNVSFDGETPSEWVAVGAPLLPLHALREHHAPRRRARRRDAGAAGRARRALPRRSRRSIARAAGGSSLEQCQFLDGRVGRARRRRSSSTSSRTSCGTAVVHHHVRNRWLRLADRRARRCGPAGAAWWRRCGIAGPTIAACSPTGRRRSAPRA